MFSIEEIEQIMEDSAEAIAKQKEIDDLLSGQLTQEDEDDVLKELEDLVEAAAADDVKVSQLPEVPTDELPGEVSFLSSSFLILRNSWTNIFYIEIGMKMCEDVLKAKDKLEQRFSTQNTPRSVF